MTINTRPSILALTAAAIATTMITTESSALDRISRAVPHGPVASHVGSTALEQRILTGNGDIFRKIHHGDKGGCNFCHDPSDR